MCRYHLSFLYIESTTMSISAFSTEVCMDRKESMHIESLQPWPNVTPWSNCSGPLNSKVQV